MCPAICIKLLITVRILRLLTQCLVLGELWIISDSLPLSFLQDLTLSNHSCLDSFFRRFRLIINQEPSSIRIPRFSAASLPAWIGYK